MPKLTIVALIKAAPDHVETVLAELEKLIAPTLVEDGCLQYDLHRDNDDPSLFLFYENWESREHWRAHMENENLKAYMAAVEGKVEEFTLKEMTHLE